MMVPAIWSHGHSDWRYIKHLNDAFGGRTLKTFPHYTYFDHLVKFPRIKRIVRLPILNYLPYRKTEAMEVLQQEFGWEYYGGKHYESIYTRFYQGYILPTKFGFDKRRSHLSCLVNNQELSREDALREIEKPAIDPDRLREDRAFVLKKLNLSESDFDAIMALPRKTFWDFPSYERDFADSVQGRAYNFYVNFPWRCRALILRGLVHAKLTLNATLGRLPFGLRIIDGLTRIVHRLVRSLSGRQT